jgi:hypothetical protein
MKLFSINDKNNIQVAEGVIFSNKKCAVNWLMKLQYKKLTGLCIYDSLEHIIDIHQGFDIIYLDRNQNEKSDAKCANDDGSVMCQNCSCWKMTRLMCS